MGAREINITYDDPGSEPIRSSKSSLGRPGARARGVGGLQNEWQLGFKPVGIFDDRPTSEKGALEDVPYGRSLTDAVAMAEEYAFDTVIFTMPQARREHLDKLMNLASLSFRYVVVMPNVGEIVSLTRICGPSGSRTSSYATTHASPAPGGSCARPAWMSCHNCGTSCGDR